MVLGGSTEKGAHIKEWDYYSPGGEFRVDKEGSPILLNCLMYKMCYYRFGQVYTEGSEAGLFCSSKQQLELFLQVGSRPVTIESAVQKSEIRISHWTYLRKLIQRNIG